MRGWRQAAVAAAVVLVAGETAQAAGFEKVVMWSGRYGGLAGATTSYVDGAQSLAFNPAGLARPEGWVTGWSDKKMGGDLSLNFSPTISRFKGPITSPAQSEGEWTFSPVFGGLASYRPMEGLGIGIGGFVSGGTRSEYENVDFSGFNPNFDTLRPDIVADLSIIEASVGAGWEPLAGLRIGAAYRVVFVSAELQSALPVPAPAGAPAGTPPVALVAVNLDDLSDTGWDGFRVGVQYAPAKGAFGLGVHWRSPVGFDADGDVSGQIEGGVGPNGPAADLQGGEARARASFPSQIVAGGFIAPLPSRKLRIFAEYSFTNYEVIRAIELDGTLQGPTGPIDVPDITTNWNSQHQMRVAAEMLLPKSMAVRAGYALTGQVTNEDFARATLASPGLGHSITVGAGGVTWGGRLQLNGAFEASFASGDGTNELGIPGEFESLGLVLHLGATMGF